LFKDALKREKSLNPKPEVWTIVLWLVICFLIKSETTPEQSSTDLPILLRPTIQNAGLTLGNINFCFRYFAAVGGATELYSSKILS
jgi:hypothetical protein